MVKRLVSSPISAGTGRLPLLRQIQCARIAHTCCGPVTATINAATAGGTVSGGTVVTSGTNSTTLTLTGYTGQVLRWQSSSDGFTTDIVDIANTSNQLTGTNLAQATKFRAELKNGDCPGAFSGPALITVSTLPIRVGSVKAARENDGIRVQWIAYNQANTAQFGIERSADGQQFTKIETVAATGIDGDVAYHWLDAKPSPARTFTVKEVYRTGGGEYSNIVYASFANSQPAIGVYPNPVVNNNVTLEFRNTQAGGYRVSFTNLAGQTVYDAIISHGGGYRSYNLPVPARIGRGLYRLMIISMDGATRNSQTLLVQ